MRNEENLLSSEEILIFAVGMLRKQKVATIGPLEFDAH